MKHPYTHLTVPQRNLFVRCAVIASLVITLLVLTLMDTHAQTTDTLQITKPKKHRVEDSVWREVYYLDSLGNPIMEHRKMPADDGSINNTPFNRIRAQFSKRVAQAMPPPLQPTTYEIQHLTTPVPGRQTLVFMPDGYSFAEKATFFADAQNSFDLLRLDPFWNTYYAVYNWDALYVESPVSGVNHPGTATDEASTSPPVPVMVNDPIFYTQFDFGSIHRLLSPTNAGVIQLDNALLANGYNKTQTSTNPTIVLLIANTTYYGGSGRLNLACFSKHASSAEIMRHELAHSFAKTTDEYAGGSCSTTTTEPFNVTAILSPLKWSSVPGVGTPSCGAYYCSCNASPTVKWYKPLPPPTTCKMDVLGTATTPKPLCPVCMMAHRYRAYGDLIALYGSANVFVTALSAPAGTTLNYPTVPSVTLRTNLPTYATVHKYVDGVEVSAFDATTITPGTHAVTIQVRDDAPWSVGATYLDNDPEVTYAWTVTNGATGTAPVIASAVSTAATCGQTNGGINITVTGTTPYTFHWNNGQTTEDLTAVGVGAYTVTVTNAFGTTGRALAVQDGGCPTAPAITGNSITSASCNGTDGAVSITVTGSTPRTYAWNNGTTTQNASALAPGTYGVTVTNATGTATGSYYVPMVACPITCDPPTFALTVVPPKSVRIDVTQAANYAARYRKVIGGTPQGWSTTYYYKTENYRKYFTMSALAPGTVYQFQVKIRCTTGYSAWSASQTATMP